MIPLATTTIRVLRTPGTDEPYEPPGEATEVAAGVRAQISTSRGSEVGGNSQEIIFFRLSCDPVDLNHHDRVEDESTQEVYEVQWVRQRQGFGLDHTQAGLKQVEGAVSYPPLVLR